MLFHLEWDILAEVLFTIIALSFFVERALSLVFEHRLYLRHAKDLGLKEPIALLVAFLVARYCDFDALSILLRRESNDTFGFLITGAVIAGGSKASIKLFHDLIKAKSSTLDKVQTLEAQGLSSRKAVEIATSRDSNLE
jgi:hypothetical protein